MTTVNRVAACLAGRPALMRLLLLAISILLAACKGSGGGGGTGY
jgi:hypothetical protein